jgi:hypothetical protein
MPNAAHEGDHRAMVLNGRGLALIRAFPRKMNLLRVVLSPFVLRLSNWKTAGAAGDAVADGDRVSSRSPAGF